MAVVVPLVAQLMGLKEEKVQLERTKLDRVFGPVET
jgi:hypothetical protein